MLKKLVTLLLVFFMLSSVCYTQSDIKVDKSGGYARILGMGANPYIIDPFYVTLNPAWGAYYDNFFFGDLGSTTTPFGNDGAGQFASINFRLSKEITLGAILTRNDFNGMSIGTLDPLGLVDQANTAIGSNAIVNLNNNVELLGTYAYHGHKFGLGLAYSGSTMDVTSASGTSTKGSASQIGINLGYLGKLMDELLIDAGLTLILPSVSYAPSSGGETKLSQTIINFAGRGYYSLSPKIKVVPSILFLAISGSADIAGASGSTSTDLSSISMISFGTGINYQVGDFLFAGGPGLLSLSLTEPAVSGSTPELSTSVFLFPVWNLGSEWYLLDWMIFRVGYTALSGSITTETAASATTIDETVATFYGPTGASVGVGFRLGSLAIDATVNDDVLRQGLNNIGGGGATFAYLSLSYGFEGL